MAEVYHRLFLNIKGIKLYLRCRLRRLTESNFEKAKKHILIVLALLFNTMRRTVYSMNFIYGYLNFLSAKYSGESYKKDNSNIKEKL